jgi:hypothetical protein
MVPNLLIGKPEVSHMGWVDKVCLLDDESIVYVNPSLAPWNTQNWYLALSDLIEAMIFKNG